MDGDPTQAGPRGLFYQTSASGLFIPPCIFGAVTVRPHRQHFQKLHVHEPNFFTVSHLDTFQDSYRQGQRRKNQRLSGIPSVQTEGFADIRVAAQLESDPLAHCGCIALIV